MSSIGARRVLFDSEAFIRHRRSGITRYFAELIGEFRADESWGVEPLTPFRYVANAHLSENLPGQYRQVPLPARWRAPVMDRLNSRAMRSAVSADIVHHSVYEPSALERWSAPKRVCTVYDFTFELFPDLFPQTQEDVSAKNLFIDRCDALLCISNTTYDDLRHFHPQLDKPVIVTHLGVSDRFFTVPRSNIRGLPDRYLLHVGNRHVHKNVDVLFQAFAAIARTDPSLHLVLCGNSLSDEPARLRELGIQERTLNLNVSDEQLPWLYHNAQAFVFPSRYEGFGLPLVEAMAAGCPTIISKTPALLEVAEDAALVFAPDDVESLTEHIQNLLGDTQAQIRLRDAGALRAADFTWRRTAEQTMHAYDQAARA